MWSEGGASPSQESCPASPASHDQELLACNIIECWNGKGTTENQILFYFKLSGARVQL